MRLFVALSPPPAVVAELDQAMAPVRESWPELRWGAVDLWHVTLAFLGEVDDDKRDELERRLERAAARHVGQSLAIGPGHAFPSVKRARVLIVRVTGERSAVDGLRALAASVRAAARRAGAPPPDDAKTFKPHLTLARIREKEPVDLSGPVTALAGLRGQPWTPVQIHLVRSVLQPVVRYETVASWPLKET